MSAVIVLSSRVSVLFFRVSVQVVQPQLIPRNHNSPQLISATTCNFHLGSTTCTYVYMTYAVQQCNSKIAAHGLSTALQFQKNIGRKSLQAYPVM